ncbi:hypothetical protein NC652_002611 [Populus alba x Populus x berolinensis]|nr:hypothetical protein NC652_002611 [Populus alba x Populus x berolinensis]
MESVVKFSGGRIPIVGFPVSPGFKLGNGSVIKASVYLVPRARVSAACICKSTMLLNAKVACSSSAFKEEFLEILRDY